jgi:hypothetical protein
MNADQPAAIISMFASKNQNSSSHLLHSLLLLPLLMCLAFAPLSGCRANNTPKDLDVPFAKIKKGMGQRAVNEIAGKPTDMGSVNRSSGVVGMLLFVPLIVWDLPLFIMRIDQVSYWVYEGQGTVVMNRDSLVHRVYYDPDEDGYYGVDPE